MQSIYLVDNNADFLFMISKVFEKCEPECRLHLFDSGHQLLQDLLELRVGGQKPFPSLIIADLKMPGMDGLRLLEKLKLNWQTINPLVSAIPVIIFSSSGFLPDIRACYTAGANSFLIKPLAFENLEKLIEQITSYWLGYNCLPGPDVNKKM
ncbi:Regulator of RpoS [Dyadobacter sp. CECT 9623]|uniref:Regulator of RpoS n=1 Tax=Dyadobacter linearis TaxID=2823330 RepID=A0ABM8UYU2_9BACT|nr:response regulator [Dyadobacter sp. CECT 9623]CAG5074792.1 Regulator of RpoS [Dyadobacter sp. CECT 9623]